MSKRIAVTLAGLALLAAGAGAVSYVGGWLEPWAPPPAASETRPSPKDSVRKALATASETAAALLGKDTPARPRPGEAKSSTPFDVARINPEGTSVIAGRAAPHARLTVLADGESIASVVADDNGEWVVVTDHKFNSRDPELRVAAAGSVPDPEPKVAPKVPSVTVAPIRPAVARAAEPPPSPSVRQITSEMMANLEQLVEAAKQERAAPPAGMLAESAPSRPTAPPPTPPASPVDQPAKPSPTPAPTGIATAQPAAAMAAGTSFATASEPAKTPAAIPIPVLFVYNQAEFTEEGRRAAALLLEYLKLKRLESVTLSGHADERGSPAFNLELSRERLATVAAFLKSGGFAGRLQLEPRGESEPFTGVDRTRFAREDLFQLDRRVELRLVN